MKFYINENNRPVIVFGKYEIAPGASGEIEFEITGGQDSVPEEAGTEIMGQAKKETAEKGERETAEQEIQAPEVYEDNFAVDSKGAKEFAEKVKEAVAQRDLEALADLTAFPIYVGLPDVGVVETRDE